MERGLAHAVVIVREPVQATINRLHVADFKIVGGAVQANVVDVEMDISGVVLCCIHVVPLGGDGPVVILAPLRIDEAAVPVAGEGIQEDFISRLLALCLYGIEVRFRLKGGDNLVRIGSNRQVLSITSFFS